MTRLEAVLQRKAAAAAAPEESDLPPPAERKRLRMAMGLTQGEMAEIIDAKRASVGAYEAGRWEPSGEVRAKYIAALNEIKKRLEEREGNQ